MPTKKHSQCTREETSLYAEDYYSTTDGLEYAIAKFKILASDCPLESSKSFYRMKVLDTQRDLELVKAKRRAFLAEEVAINPPNQVMVDKTKIITEALGKVQANENNANVIIDTSRKIAEAFIKLYA